jgi:glycosyltransferase involved in cell wall biosynthesis
LNIGHRVKFWGNVEREDVLVHLGECNVLVHPSLHESGGWICAEAMAAGRPVLGLNIGGPAVQVTDAEGILLPANTPQQVVKDLSVAMRRLIDNPDLVRQLGAAGKIRVQQELDWQHKVNHMLGVYQQIAKSSSEKIYEENKQGYTTEADV